MPEVIVEPKAVVETSDKQPKVNGTTEEHATLNGVAENGDSAAGSASLQKQPETSPEKSEAEILVAQGKRHLFVKDYPSAVAALGDACAKFSELYGDLADECADVYFSYGRALLELSREESNVLGNAVEPDKESEESEDDEDGEENGDGLQEEDDEENKQIGTNEKEDEGKSEGKGKEDKESAADETIDTTKELKEGDEINSEEMEEDVNNLQLAWEVFESAKLVYERQKADAKLAETYLYLGEVGLESENYTGAIEDMKKCIEIQKQIHPSDHRDIAETYFQLGIACSLCNKFDEAVGYFKNASEVLELRINNLEKNGAPESETSNNPFYSVEKEISEMKALLPEIKDKISDMIDFKEETMKSVMMATLKNQVENSDGAGTSSSAAVVTKGSPEKRAAMDISHLIRKKRKSESEDVSSEHPTKKACTEEAKEKGKQ